MTDSKRIWTVPNVLTMFRMALIPVYWVLMIGYEKNYWALGVFVLAACTDMLDGFLARKYHQITDFGKLMDPLADKLMTLSVMATLLIRGIISWEALALLALKEFIMLVGGILLYNRKIVVHSLFVGKFAQTCLCLALILSFFADKFENLSFQPHTALLWIGVGAAYSALVVYVRSVIRQLRGVENTYKAREEKQ
ncbi:MAG: CDP-alcohol phosphatidyltransferase family protein [Clostridia bacterium]|nr:CDP-alcohol phosphatidyltransferase family protein [Clostridia bacterium]